MIHSALQSDPKNLFLDGLMESHEITYRMQAELPDVIDLVG